VKLKLRFDKESLQAFFLGNVEKIVFAAILIGCVLMIYFSGRKTFTGTLPTAKELQDSAKRAEENVENTSPRNCSLYQECKETDYTVLAGSSKDPVDEKLYAQPNIWNTPVFDAKILRDSPKVFGVQNLRAVFGRGPFTLPASGGGSGSEVRGRRWIVVTGSVPYKKQLDEYDRVFQPAVAYDPKADVPAYKGYVIERAEVGAGEKLEWQAIDVEAALKKAKFLGNPLTDTLEGKYLDPALVFPLPPLAGKQWGPETQHEDIIGPSFDTVKKDIAAAKDRKVIWSGDFRNIDQTAEQKEERPLVAFIAKQADPGKPVDDRTFAVLFPTKEIAEQFNRSGSATVKGKVAGAERIKLPAVAAAAGKEISVPLLVYDAPVAKADTPDEPTATEGEGRRGGRPLNATGPGPGPASGPQQNEVVDYRLFRFFDLDVKPGKHYQYRVRLVLANPNYLEEADKAKPKPGTKDSETRRSPLEARFLKNAADGVDKTLTTAATGPTEPVTVPEDLRLLALSVAPPARPFAKNDPSGMTGKMAVVQWVPANGREARHEFGGEKKAGECVRGTLANFRGQAPTMQPGELAGKRVDFVTDSIVLDMAIAQVEKDTNGTGEIVVVDGYGRLRVYSQLEGELEDKLLRARAATVADHPEEAPTVRPGDQPVPSRGRPPLQEGGPIRKFEDFNKRSGEP
jgi:hypothetical protein